MSRAYWVKNQKDVRSTNRKEERSMLLSSYQLIYISSLVRVFVKDHPTPTSEVDSTLNVMLISNR